MLNDAGDADEDLNSTQHETHQVKGENLFCTARFKVCKVSAYSKDDNTFMHELTKNIFLMLDANIYVCLLCNVTHLIISTNL